MNIEFGGITASGNYTDNPMRSRLVEQFDFEFGNRPGMNLFMSEEAQHAAALERGEGENLFMQG